MCALKLKVNLGVLGLERTREGKNLRCPPRIMGAPDGRPHFAYGGTLAI